MSFDIKFITRLPHLAAASLMLFTPIYSQSLAKSKHEPEAPNLNGTWVLDHSRSKLDSEIKDYVLTIVHKEPEIRFARRYKRGKREINENSVYYTDGRPQFIYQSSQQPDIRWRDKKLVVKTISKPTGGPVKLEFVTVEEWSVSTDKQTLTRTMTGTGPGVAWQTKAVFVRQP